MTRDEILGLRPAEGASGAEVTEAIAAAQRTRKECVDRLAAAELVRKEQLLTASDKELAAAAKAVTESAIDIDRIDALLPLMVAQRDQALGREAIAELQARHATLADPVAELEKWQRESYPEVIRLIGEGLHAQRRAEAALAQFTAQVTDAYRQRHVREAGALGVALPELAAPLPSAQFPNWRLP